MGSPPPYRLFDAHVAHKTALSPALTRITFSGIDLAAMKTVAPDQRIKIFLPHGDGRPSTLPKDAGWYQAWRAVPPTQRAPMRTYTIRHLRAEKSELDVDFVLHGATGPASRWAIAATAGSPVQIAAPNRDFAGDPGGFEWKPLATARACRPSSKCRRGPTASMSRNFPVSTSTGCRVTPRHRRGARAR